MNEPKIEINFTINGWIILVLLFCVYVLAGVATEYIHKKEHKPEQKKPTECAVNIAWPGMKEAVTYVGVTR